MSTSIVSPVQSVILSPVELLIHGKPASEFNETLFQLGFDSCKAYDAEERAQRTIAQCQTALFDFVKGLNYVQFQHVREQFIAGGVDSGKTTGAAEQIWDKQVNQVCKAFGFTRPKSEAKDAVRKAEQKAKREAEMAKFSDENLEARIVALIAEGKPASLKEAGVLKAEVERRNKPELDKVDAIRKDTGDKIIARVRELVKAKTSDADDILFSMLSVSQVYR